MRGGPRAASGLGLAPRLKRPCTPIKCFWDFGMARKHREKIDQCRHRLEVKAGRLKQCGEADIELLEDLRSDYLDDFVELIA